MENMRVGVSLHTKQGRSIFRILLIRIFPNSFWGQTKVPEDKGPIKYIFLGD